MQDTSSSAASDAPPDLYRPPSVSLDKPVDSTNPAADAEAVRLEYLPREVTAKTLGAIYMFLCLPYAFFLFMGLTVIWTDPIGGGLYLLLFGLLAGVFATAGLGLWRLEQWGQRPACWISAVGCLGFPIGTVLHGSLLYLLVNERGKMVFSDEYRRVVELTPHIKPVAVWTRLAIFALIVGLLILLGWFWSPR